MTSFFLNFLIGLPRLNFSLFHSCKFFGTVKTSGIVTQNMKITVFHRIYNRLKCRLIIFVILVIELITNNKNDFFTNIWHCGHLKDSLNHFKAFNFFLYFKGLFLFFSDHILENHIFIQKMGLYLIFRFLFSKILAFPKKLYIVFISFFL